MALNFRKKYTDEMPQKLFDNLSQGGSISQFCAEILTSRETYYKWIEKEPEFGEAHRVGMEACQAFWEKIMKAGCLNRTEDLKKLGTKKLDLGPAYFTLKTRFHRDYSDKQEIQASHEVKLNYSLDDTTNNTK